MIYRSILFSMLLWRVYGAETLRIEIIEGDGAVNNVRLQRAKEPVVRVVNEAGNPISGAVVHFAAPSQGPSLAFSDGGRTATILTDGDGRAMGRSVRPNKTPGRFEVRVTASYQGATATARIVQVNAESVELTRGSSRKVAILAIIGVAAAGGAVLAALSGRESATAAPSTLAAPTTGTIITAGAPVLGAP